MRRGRKDRPKNHWRKKNLAFRAFFFQTDRFWQFGGISLWELANGRGMLKTLKESRHILISSLIPVRALERILEMAGLFSGLLSAGGSEGRM